MVIWMPPVASGSSAVISASWVAAGVAPKLSTVRSVAGEGAAGVIVGGMGALAIGRRTKQARRQRGATGVRHDTAVATRSRAW